MAPNRLIDPDAASGNPLTWGMAAEDTAASSAVGSAVARFQQWIAAERAKSAQMGLWDDQTGLPTGKGLVDAAQQYTNALLLSTSAPGGRGFSLERIHPRTLKPMAEGIDASQPGKHAYSIKDPEGRSVGIVDTEWNPETGGLHIADFQSDEGPGSLGIAAVRQIRDQLVSQYPGVRSLSGQRITGAVSADRRSGSGPGRAATQTMSDQ